MGEDKEAEKMAEVLKGKRIEVKVHYCKEEDLFVGKETQSLTEEEFEEKYEELPISLDGKKMSRKDSTTEILETTFTLFDGNLMSREPMQDWISTNLQPDPHTSMRTGDIVEINGVYHMCVAEGWERLDF